MRKEWEKKTKELKERDGEGSDIYYSRDVPKIAMPKRNVSFTPKSERKAKRPRKADKKKEISTDDKQSQQALERKNDRNSECPTIENNDVDKSKG